MTMQHWLLLERTESLLPEIYRLSEDPAPVRLFDGTELAACAEESPLLLDTRHNPALLAALRSEPSRWPGLLLQTSGPLAELLAHLRHILFIRFDSKRRGVLRYSSPRTASYFFPACDHQALPIWLGPIHTLSWHGGTWRDAAQGGASWRHLENRQAIGWRAQASPREYPLDAQQQHALQLQQREQFLYPWWERQPGTRFETAWQYLVEGMQAGFVSADALTAYLDLRQANPHAQAPAELPGGSDEIRLRALAQYLATQPLDKERRI